MKLHGYFRSAAAYRVRIALNLKGLPTDHLPHHLRKGEQCAPAFLAINPQGLVPALEGDGGEVLVAHEAGPFCFGDKPSLADLCLVPQLGNARRFGVDVSAFPRLLKAEAAAKEMTAFNDAAPDRQADAE